MLAESIPLRRCREVRNLPRVCQISEYHCGPAVLQMLLGHCGIHARQEHLTELADVAATIGSYGARVDQLARAVAWLNEGVRLWYKNCATAEDLIAVVCHYHWPAGVEWQGLFEDSEADEDFSEGDYGHYSIVTCVNQRRGLITIRDPYPDFWHTDRVFRLAWFMQRWWDINATPVPGKGALRLVEDRRMLFVVTEERASFPAALGMIRG